MIGVLIISGCLFLCAITTSSTLFIFLFATGIGFMDTMGWVPPISLGIKYYPGHKSMITGIITCGMGISPLIFSFIALAIVNPDNKEPTIIVKDGEAEDKYYTRDVYQNVYILINILILRYPSSLI